MYYYSNLNETKLLLTLTEEPTSIKTSGNSLYYSVYDISPLMLVVM